MTQFNANVALDVEALKRRAALTTVNPATGGVSLSADGIPDVLAATGYARTTPVRIATFGDSTANVGTTNTDTGYYTAPFPGSGATVISTEFAKFDTHLFYPQAKLVANGGISGETTTQMLARDTLAASASRKAITDIINLAPDVVLLRGGSINDIVGAVPATIASLTASTYANHIAIINRLLSAGVTVIDEGIFGFSGAATDIAAVRSVLTQLNAMYAGYAKTLNSPRLRFIDLTGLLRDSSGAYLTGISADGTHLNQLGGWLLGQTEAALLTTMFGVSAGPRFPGVNLITNPFMASTTVVGYGTVGTGYSVAAGNGTVANAKIEVIDGKVWQTAEITPTATGNTATLYMPFPVTTMGIVANDIYGCEVDWMIQGLNGANVPVPTGLYIRNDLYKNAAGRFIVADTTALFADLQTNRVKAHSSFALQIQEPSANLTTSSIFPFFFGTNDMTPYKIGVSHPRFVKLNQTVVTG